jgi:hypothetical protein
LCFITSCIPKRKEEIKRERTGNKGMKKEKIMTGSKGDTRGTKNDRSILKGAA